MVCPICITTAVVTNVSGVVGAAIGAVAAIKIAQYQKIAPKPKQAPPKPKQEKPIITREK